MNSELQKLGFKPSNISNIARFKRCIELTEITLLSNITPITAMLQSGFIPSNISSILNSSGINIKQNIRNIRQNNRQA